MYRNSIFVLLAGASSLTTASPAVDPIHAILRVRQGLDVIPTSTITTSLATKTVDACWSTLNSILLSAPTVPPEYLEWQISKQIERIKTEPITPLFSDLDSVSTACSRRFSGLPQVTTSAELPPASILDDWEEYQSSARPWLSSIRPAVSEAASACSSKYPHEAGELLWAVAMNGEDCLTAGSLYLSTPATETWTETRVDTSSGATETETEAEAATTTETVVPAEETTTTTTTTTATTAGAVRETGYVVAVVAAAVGVAGVMGAM